MSIVTVYTQPRCPHCEEAKAYLEENNIPYEAVDIREHEWALDFMRAMKHTTTPQLYVNDVLLVAGGNAGLRQFTGEQIAKRVAEISV